MTGGVNEHQRKGSTCKKRGVARENQRQGECLTQKTSESIRLDAVQRRVKEGPNEEKGGAHHL